jgi:hypothetical protein
VLMARDGERVRRRLRFKLRFRFRLEVEAEGWTGEVEAECSKDERRRLLDCGWEDFRAMVVVIGIEIVRV